jgi:hypothetical protein
MILQKQTQTGLTFGQLIAVAAILGGLIASYTDLNVRIAKLEEHKTQIENRISNAEKSNEISRQENRSDHLRIEAKMDILIQKISR